MCHVGIAGLFKLDLITHVELQACNASKDFVIAASCMHYVPMPVIDKYTVNTSAVFLSLVFNVFLSDV